MFKYLKAKYLKAKKAKICDLEAKNIETETLIAENINTSTINGIQTDCIFNNPIQNYQFVDYFLNGINVDPFTPGAEPKKPDKPDQFSSMIWDALWNNTLLQLNEPCFGLAARLQCGRLTQRYYSRDCVICPDEFPNCTPILEPNYCEGITGACSVTAEGFCPSVPIRILAIETFSLLLNCSINSQITQNIISTVSYNLDTINVSQYLSTRVISILVQLAYIVKGQTKIVQLAFQNKQISPSLDSLYGENFSATILIPTDLTKNILASMPQTLYDNAAIQIVIYIEQGLEVQILKPVTALIIQNSQNSDAQFLQNGNSSTMFTSNITIPFNINMKTVTCFGGGGAGGSAIIASGGGGGSGFCNGDAIPVGTINISITIGLGGTVDKDNVVSTDGGNTVVNFLDANNNAIGSVIALGGKAGQNGTQTFNKNVSGSGGQGQYGGGGGSININQLDFPDIAGNGGTFAHSSTCCGCWSP